MSIIQFFKCLVAVFGLAILLLVLLAMGFVYATLFMAMISKKEEDKDDKERLE